MSTTEIIAIQQEMTVGQPSPSQIADFRVRLAGYYASSTDEFGELEMYRAREWERFRKDSKSAADAERAFEASEQGQRYLKLKHTLRKLEKLMSACGSKLRTAENEARGNY